MENVVKQKMKPSEAIREFIEAAEIHIASKLWELKSIEEHRLALVRLEQHYREMGL